MLEKVTIKVSGMMCVRCEAAVKNALLSSEGVINADVSFTLSRAKIEYDPQKTNKKKLEKVINKSGYNVVISEDESRKKEFKSLLLRFIVSLCLSLPFLLMMVLMFVFPNAHLTHILHSNGLWQFILALPVQFGIGFKFYKGAFLSLKNKSPGMDLLVSFGTTSAFVYSCYNLISGNNEFYFESSVIIITLILFGKMLEMRAKTKTSEAIEKLVALTPKTAVVIRDNKEVTINTEDILVGDIVLVHPGEAIPTDGIVVKGETFIDEAMLTGESLPVKKTEGASVFGGTINKSGSIQFKATKNNEETALSEIIRLVEDASTSKATIQTLADKVSAIFVPSVLTIAILTFILTLIITNDPSEGVKRAVAVLVIACPCSLGLATPTALMVGIGKGAEHGILIKDADALEKASCVKVMVFDKTGTLTQGKPTLTEVFTISLSKSEALKIAASVERFSEHPISEAITSGYNGEYYEIESFQNHSGFGVEGVLDGKVIKLGKKEFCSIENEPESAKDFLEGNKQTIIYMSINNEIAAIFSVSDPVKTESLEVINELKTQKVHTCLVSGDNEKTVLAVTEALGIDEAFSEVLPSEKVQKIKELKDKYGLTAMAGDGINDAPALKTSDVGFSMGNGTDIALSSGDIVLLGGNIELIPKTIKLSNETMKKIKQNLFWAFFYNSLSIPLAAFGFLSPVVAGAAMALSSVSVVTNSLLLKRKKI